MRLRVSSVFHRFERSHFSEQLIFDLDLRLNMRFMKNIVKCFSSKKFSTLDVFLIAGGGRVANTGRA